MSETKDFHIGTILSITTGRLLSLDHIGGVYDILGWMTGEDLMTHQLPRASRECEAFLISQHPDLVIDVPTITSEADLIAFLGSLYPTLGEFRPVEPLPTEDHTHIDPIAEIRMMRPDAQIIVVGP